MQVTARAKYNLNGFSLASIKTFLIWSFTLTVCFLVVGFPLGFVLASIGVLITVALHAVMPVSSVLLVGSIFLALNVLVVLLGAATLTLKGIKPQDVSWLSWLHGTAELQYSKTYASCPLTCEIAEGK